MATPRGQGACCIKSIGWLSIIYMLSGVVYLTFSLALDLVAPRSAVAEGTGAAFLKRHYVTASQQNYCSQTRNNP